MLVRPAVETGRGTSRATGTDFLLEDLVVSIWATGWGSLLLGGLVSERILPPEGVDKTPGAGCFETLSWSSDITLSGVLSASSINS